MTVPFEKVVRSDLDSSNLAPTRKLGREVVHVDRVRIDELIDDTFVGSHQLARQLGTASVTSVNNKPIKVQDAGLPFDWHAERGTNTPRGIGYCHETKQWLDL